MSSTATSLHVIGKAEQAFRDAFERLKRGKPEVLPKGTPVSQNNVAREARRDPSALKKDRYPSLIREIQLWVDEHPSASPPSPRQAILGTRRRNRSLNEKIETLKIERDRAMSLLVEADAKILELTVENARMAALLPKNTVLPMRPTSTQQRGPTP
jgi:hypothetical protein